MQCICGNEKESLKKHLVPLNGILKNYPHEERYLVPILQDAQDEYGYLPFEVLLEIAKNLHLSFSKVYGVVTFYTQFHLKPRGKNVVRICTGTACHVRGAGEVLEAIESELGIQSGETTADLKFTLETVACIGACGLAPVIMINDDTHGRINAESVRAILDSYQDHPKTNGKIDMEKPEELKKINIVR